MQCVLQVWPPHSEIPGLGQLLRETGAPGVVSKVRKTDFQSSCPLDRVCHKLQGVLSFNQVKGPVVVAGSWSKIQE